MASLKYRHYRIDAQTSEWVLKQKFTLPLFVLKLSLLLVPEFVMTYFLRKVTEDLPRIKWIPPKEGIKIIYNICDEIAKTTQHSTIPAGVVFEMVELQEKSVLLVE